MLKILQDHNQAGGKITSDVNLDPERENTLPSTTLGNLLFLEKARRSHEQVRTFVDWSECLYSTALLLFFSCVNFYVLSRMTSMYSMP